MHYCYVCSGKKKNSINSWHLNAFFQNLFFVLVACKSSIMLSMSWNFFLSKFTVTASRGVACVFAARKRALVYILEEDEEEVPDTEWLPLPSHHPFRWILSNLVAKNKSAVLRVWFYVIFISVHHYCTKFPINYKVINSNICVIENMLFELLFLWIGQLFLCKWQRTKSYDFLHCRLASSLWIQVLIWQFNHWH